MSRWWEAVVWIWIQVIISQVIVVVAHLGLFEFCYDTVVFLLFVANVDLEIGTAIAVGGIRFPLFVGLLECILLRS